MAEIPPNTTSGLIACEPIMEFITYNGEVPISPKIIPNVTKIPPSESLLCSS